MRKAVSSTITERRRRFAWGAAVLCGALALPGLQSAHAQSTCSEGLPAGKGCPTTFPIAAKPLQKVPTTFKFQSRISQAKLPLGDAKLKLVQVKLERASGEEVCSETLKNVMVRDSVLNVEIGRGMSCQLDEKIAQYNDLSFKVCIGGGENCLKPIALSTVPQAIKSTFAVQAQEAYKAQVAAQSSYAHRITADADMATPGQVGRGYYDFQTPSNTTVFEGTLATNAQTNSGGYIQWTPVTGNDSDKVLHVALGSVNGTTRTLRDLADLYLHATMTDVMGALRVANGATVIAGGVTVNQGGVTVQQGGAVVHNGGLNVKAGETRLDDQARALAGLEVQSGLVVTSGGALVSAGGLTVNGAATMNDGATVHNGLTVSSGMTTIQGGATVANGLTVSSGVARFEGGAAITGGLEVATPSSFQGTLQVTSGGVSVTGDSTFNDVVTFAKAPVFLTGTPVTGNTVNSGAIVDGSVMGVDIGSGQVTDAHLASGINGSKITAGSIARAQIGDGQISNEKLAGGITQDKLAGGITADKLAGSIPGSKLAGGISGALITARSIDGGEIAINGISPENIAMTRQTIPFAGVLPGYVERFQVTSTSTASNSITMIDWSDPNEKRGVCFMTQMVSKGDGAHCEVVEAQSCPGFICSTVKLNGLAKNASCSFICF